MFICVQTPVCAWVHMSMCNACQTSKWTLVFSSGALALCIKAGSLLCDTRACQYQSRQLVYAKDPISASYAKILGVSPHVPGLYVGSWCLNCSFRVCTASISLDVPSPVPHCCCELGWPCLSDICTVIGIWAGTTVTRHTPVMQKESLVGVA